VGPGKDGPWRCEMANRLERNGGQAIIAYFLKVMMTNEGARPNRVQSGAERDTAFRPIRRAGPRGDFSTKIVLSLARSGQ